MTALAVLGLLSAIALSTVLLAAVVAAVWWFDRYDREPLHLIVGVFAWGALAAPVLSVFLRSVIAAGLGSDLWLAVAIGPALEEAAKAIGIALVALLSREFDNPTDGVVYGTACGLGFAATENLVYGVAGAGGGDLGGALALIALRTVLAAGIHGVCSATVGGCLGHAYLSHGRWSRLCWSMAGLVLATTVHTAWNLGLMRAGDGSRVAVEAWFLAVPVLYSGYLAALGAFLRSEHRILRRELSEEVELDVLPSWVLEVIPYYRRRVRSDWWPSRRERTVLARLMTRLAFRKHAIRRLPDDEAALAGLEVVQLRRRIREMLEDSEQSGWGLDP